MRRVIRVALGLFLALSVVGLAAQDATPTPEPTPSYPPYPPETGVYVTTQDYLSLRAGPSTYFE
ncbi:MAG: hypothetical protein AAF125_22590, partial [Chloroflexota bacterium]